MLLATLVGWLDRERCDVIAFLREENRALKTQLAGRRPQLMMLNARDWRSWGAGSDAASSERW